MASICPPRSAVAWGAAPVKVTSVSLVPFFLLKLQRGHVMTGELARDADGDLAGVRLGIVPRAHHQKKRPVEADFCLHLLDPGQRLKTTGSHVASAGNTRTMNIPNICRPMNCIIPA